MSEPTTWAETFATIAVFVGVAVCIHAHGVAMGRKNRAAHPEPDLLSALKSLTDYADAGNDPDTMPEEARRIAVARAAIAKAEGCATPSSKGNSDG